MTDYIIAEEGISELDKYFIEHKDPLIKIAWKNLKDQYVRQYKEEYIPNFHKCLHKELRNDVEFCHYHDKEIHATLTEHDAQVEKNARNKAFNDMINWCEKFDDYTAGHMFTPSFVLKKLRYMQEGD